MADIHKLEPWLNQRFEYLTQERLSRIAQWDKTHRPEKEKAKHQISLLYLLLEKKPLLSERNNNSKITKNH